MCSPTPDQLPSMPPEFVVVVSGYPRSGTSMMMQILEAGGLDVVIDEDMLPDKRNPRGFYETRNPFWMKAWLEAEAESRERLEAVQEEVQGKAIKVLAWCLRHLPATYRYKVVFMRRRVEEIIASGREMGIVRKKIPLSEREQVLAFKGEYVHYEIWIARQPHMDAIFLDYNDVVARPREELDRIRQFLGLPLDLEGMVAAIDPSLYRQRVDPAHSGGVIDDQG